MRPWWLRPGVHTGVIGGAAGYILGHLLGNFLSSDYARNALSDVNDVPIVLGYTLAVIGWLAGLGVFNDLGRLVLGKPLLAEVRRGGRETGYSKYFRYTLDHKVVGIQYLFGMIGYFLTGGLFAMAIRSELLSPTYHLLGPNQYLMVVGEHGTMMMMMMSSVILGPFGQYFGPLLIGSKRVAFPRLEALGFWLTPAAYVILLSAILFGGFPTGWTGYEPLATQAGQGMDAYFFAFGLMGISMILAGFNMIVTIINYRAPGMKSSRLPMFVWSMFTVSFLQVLAVPVLVGACYMGLMDRTFQTAFFAKNQLGGSSFLYEDLFWFFGHPEVYILALPGFGVISEVVSVFCRKPLFGYRVAAAGMLGVGILSFFVWQHHLFDSGINPDMRPLFMLTTELISIPTGFIYLVGMGTFWKAKIRFSIPMLFALAFYFNFLIGGISGVFLSDVPADTTEHGSFFVMAHFHYTIMGGLIFAFIAGIYYWLPKMTGIKLNDKLGKIHFWTMFIFFNTTFLPLFALGLLGMPRRVFEYARNLQTLNDWVSICAFLPGRLDPPLFVINFVMSMLFWREREVGNPWRARSLEWQLSSPPPPENFERVPVILSGPYDYGVPNALPVADLNPPPASSAPRTRARAEWRRKP